MYAARGDPGGQLPARTSDRVVRFDSPAAPRAFRFLMKRLRAGAFEQKERTMKLTGKADLYKRTNRELAGLKEEVRKDIGNCEQQRRKDYSALEDIRKVQGQRRIMRPNL